MYEELIGLLRDYGRDCTENDMCENCSIQYFCENGWTPSEIANAIEALSRMEKTTQWIPVTERLPEEYTRVIGFMAWKAMTAIEYQNGKWYSIDHLAPLPDEAVTHWMPLPEPPKEETE